MGLKVQFIHAGLIDYKDAWQKQEALFDEVTEAKLQGKPKKNYLIFCEHPHVYTLGKSGNESNLLINAIQLQARNAAFVKTNRGGDITYHGPGQLVAYPVFDLEEAGIGLKAYIYRLEEIIIQVLKAYGISGYRLDSATGVWLDADSANPRKICSIGVKTSRFVSMHGLAFNIHTDLDYFDYINPCGFTDKKMTSLSKELPAGEPDFEIVVKQVKEAFRNLFDIQFVE